VNCDQELPLWRHVSSFARTDLVLDPAPATQVLALWTRYGRDGSADGRSRAEAKRIADSPAYTTLRRYLREQFACVPTQAEAARAIELPDSGICGLGLDPAFRARTALSALATAIAKDKAAIAARATSRAAAYLPTARSWKPVHIWFLIASQTMFDCPINECGRERALASASLFEPLRRGATRMPGTL